MTTCNRNDVARKFIKYIELNHPEVLLIVRAKNTPESRRRGYRSGQPDILILGHKCIHNGLAIWVISEMTESIARSIKRFAHKSYDTIVSDNYVDLRVRFGSYMAGCDLFCEVDTHQLEVIKRSNRRALRRYSPRTTPPLTDLDYETIRSVAEYVRDEYPSAVLVPGLGDDKKPDLTMVSPNSTHNGIAMWISETFQCYHFNKLSNKQLSCVKIMAGMSYLTIASKYYQDLTGIIDMYMIGEYEHGNHLPEFCDDSEP